MSGYSGGLAFDQGNARAALDARESSLHRFPHRFAASEATDLGHHRPKARGTFFMSRLPEGPATMHEAVKFFLLPQHAAALTVRDSKARLYPPLAEAPDQKQTSQLAILRDRVMEYWVDDVLKHSLYSEMLISLGKRQIDKAVDAPWKYRLEVSDAISSGPLDDRDVIAIYDATGLLLILGEPGSGKTTTLLALLGLSLTALKTTSRSGCRSF